MADEREDEVLELTEEMEVEEADGTEAQKEEAETAEAEQAEEETVITLGDEEAAPASEGSDSDLVRHLRATIREKDKELKRLQTESAPQKIEVGEEPTLESSGYDEDAFKADWTAWKERKAEAEKQNATQNEAAEKAQADWQADLGTFAEQKTSLRVADFDDAEEEVVSTFDQVQQAVLVKAATNKAAVIYALGKNKAKAAELAKITDPIKLAVAVSKLEGELKVTTRRKAPSPEEQVSGSGRISGGGNAIEKEIERLEAKAARDPSFDRAPIAKLRKQLRDAGK